MARAAKSGGAGIGGTGAERGAAAEEIEAELRALRADVAALAAALKAYGGAAAEDVRARAEGSAEEALAESLRVVRDLRGKVDGLQAQVEGDVRANPFAWLIGAAGLGLLLGLILGRRG